MWWSCRSASSQKSVYDRGDEGQGEESTLSGYLLASEDQAGYFLVPNLCLDVIDSVRRFDFEGNGLPTRTRQNDSARAI